jgi:predicted neutral ceramidase superfamily lipid hydrolase
MPFPFTGIMIPTDNDKTAGSEHLWVSDRERVKVLSTVIQQMLVVLGAMFVVQTKSLIDLQTYLYGTAYLCAILLYVCLFAITIRQAPYNESLFECVFLMVITGTMTVLIAWESNTWIRSGSAVVWIGGVYFVVVGSKGEVTKQYYNFVEPIAQTWYYRSISRVFGFLYLVTSFVFWCIGICATFVWGVIWIGATFVWEVIKIGARSN